MKYSIVIPAHNEEHRIGKCLDSIRHAEMPPDSELEVIVVLNRCTDGTERIARDFGATVVRDDTKNLAHIRNSGAAVATGDILVTIDADSWMSENMIIKVTRALESGKYIGGGVEIFPERCSVGIHATIALLKVLLFFTGLTGGLYWCYRKDFEEMGGFNEDLYIGEDLDFARRLNVLQEIRQIRRLALPENGPVPLARRNKRPPRKGSFPFEQVFLRL
jgi:glycosyltransferase involved in cell wall biosynthesis